MKSKIAMLSASLILATPGTSLASSTAGWAALEQSVAGACVRASGIRNARPSSIVQFDDRAGKVAMLVSDRGRGSPGTKLCLYDKRSRKAYVDEAEGWSAPPQRR